MSTTYPNGIDDAITLPLVFDNITDVTADTVNRLRYAIVNIEQALGINPQGIFTSMGGVRARLDNVDVQITNLNTSVANVITEVNAIIAALDGEHIKLGTPVDGFLTGITPLQSTTVITEAINTFNNIMFYLAPEQAQSMDNLVLDAVTVLPIITGSNVKVADVTGHAPGYFKNGAPAGSGNYLITKTQTFTLTTHNTNDATTGFSDGDKGIIDVLINNISVATFNLGTAFDEAHRTDTNGQGITYNGNTGSASPPLFVVNSHAQIYSIALFNSLPLWQKGVVRIPNTILTPGYNTFQIEHTVDASTRTSQLFELFYDNGALNPVFPSTPTLSINAEPSHNFLSGIKYLTTGDSLLLNATINNAFVNTYLQIPITYSFSAAIPSVSGDIADVSLTVGPTGTASAPNSTDHITINKVFSIATLNQQSVDEIATVVYSNIYGTTFQASSASQNLLVNTYNSPASTASNDSFVDENRRLRPDINGANNTSAAYPNDYVGIPPTITGQWDSTVALVNGNAQVFDSQLIYPHINFTTNHLPSQGGNTDYSGFNNANTHNGQVYYRAMYSPANPRSTGTLTLGGIILTDLTQMSPNIKVEMKLPGESGWKDFSLPFDVGTFVLATNGQGCRTGNSGNLFGWSMGTGTTATSGFMYILRITLFNTTRQVTSLVESFTDTF